MGSLGIHQHRHASLQHLSASGYVIPASSVALGCQRLPPGSCVPVLLWHTHKRRNPTTANRASIFIFCSCQSSNRTLFMFSQKGQERVTRQCRSCPGTLTPCRTFIRELAMKSAAFSHLSFPCWRDGRVPTRGVSSPPSRSKGLLCCNAGQTGKEVTAD